MKTRLGLLLYAAAHQPVDLSRNARMCLAHLGRFVLEDRVHHFDRRLAGERTRAGQHLAQDHAEAEDVGAMVRLFPANLFGRHVADRPHHDPGGGQGLSGLQFRTCGVRALDPQLGETKVEDLQPTVRCHEDVVGLEVAVDDAAVVRRGETLRDLLGVVEGLANPRRAVSQDRAQLFAFEQFGDDVGRAAMRSDVVDGENVRVIESRSGSRLLFEAGEAVSIAG